jgi:ATP-dependent DNA ligase
VICCALPCERDVEGSVGKWAAGTYRTNGRATSWLKIKNREYSQMRDRHQLFASRTCEISKRSALLARPDLVLR